MFGIITRRKDDRIISDATVRHEAAVKNKDLRSLAFEATYHLDKLPSENFLAAVGKACPLIAKELLLMRQVQLAEGQILAPQRPGFTWIPAIVATPNEHNVILPTDKVVPAKNVRDFQKLLAIIAQKEGVYELVPGLALFGDNGRLGVTASRQFIANLNNE